jgi:ornithine--oxo-acid transaminase
MATTARPDGAGRSPVSTDPVTAERHHAAHIYHPLPVTLVEGEGAWVTDIDGVRYLDLLCAYSALNFGHRHPTLVAAARSQLERLTLTSRAVHNDQLGPFCAELVALLAESPVDEARGEPSRLDVVVPMNTGAEAVETAIKTVRRWAYDVKGVPADRATVIVAAENFHGRTTTIVGFSSDRQARRAFGPFAPGFRSVPFGDIDALDAAIDDTTAAVLLEPVQGEAGVVIPPPGYLRAVRDRCDRHDVLLVADEIQSGLGRTGRTLACDHEGVRPDLVLLGKALGGGIVPLSVVVGRRDVMATLEPGSHGSTFGGNPLACAVGRAVVGLLRTGEPQRQAGASGVHLAERLAALTGDPGGQVAAVRSIGLWAGIDLTKHTGTAREVSERLLRRGVLVKDTRRRTLRLAPPLTISRAELDLALDRVVEVLTAPG